MAFMAVSCVHRAIGGAAAGAQVRDGRGRINSLHLGRANMPRLQRGPDWVLPEYG
jgi:hypothetical protein